MEDIFKNQSIEIRKRNKNDKTMLFILDFNNYEKLKETALKSNQSITLLLNNIISKWSKENENI